MESGWMPLKPAPPSITRLLHRPFMKVASVTGFALHLDIGASENTVHGVLHLHDDSACLTRGRAYARKGQPNSKAMSL
jgi:hypothetical protein